MRKMKTAAVLVGGVAGFGCTFIFLYVLLEFQNGRPWHQFVVSFREKGINAEGLISVGRQERTDGLYCYYATVTYAAVQYRGRKYFMKCEFHDDDFKYFAWGGGGSITQSVALMILSIRNHEALDIWVILSIVLCYPFLKASVPEQYHKHVKSVTDDENIEMDIQDPANDEHLSLLPKIDEGKI